MHFSGTPIRSSTSAKRFQTGLFWLKIISFRDPQSGAEPRLIDFKLVHFWSKTAKNGILCQNTSKQLRDPTTSTQGKTGQNLLQTDNKQQTDRQPCSDAQSNVMALRAINNHTGSTVTGLRVMGSDRSGFTAQRTRPVKHEL